jgi:hypothetical protein
VAGSFEQDSGFDLYLPSIQASRAARMSSPAMEAADKEVKAFLDSNAGIPNWEKMQYKVRWRFSVFLKALTVTRRPFVHG